MGLREMLNTALTVLEAHSMNKLSEWIRMFLVPNETGTVPLEKRIRANCAAHVLLIGVWWALQNDDRLPPTETWSALTFKIEGRMYQWYKARLRQTLGAAQMTQEWWTVRPEERPGVECIGASLIEEVRQFLGSSIYHAERVNAVIARLTPEARDSIHLN